MEADSEAVLDVLAGYFYKIVKKLLESCKNAFLQHVLVRREADLFDGIKKHMGHLSVS